MSAQVQMGAPSFDGLLAPGGLTSAYQPILDLGTGETVGYEALARGPAGTRYERPDQLFAAARSAGATGELDAACRRAALDGARDAGLTPETCLFINVEPSTLTTVAPEDLAAELALPGGPRVILEVTERVLGRDPAKLFAAVGSLRAAGFAFALDDVGADVEALALMPFLAPEVIKLDLRLVQERTAPDVAAIVHAVGAEAERTGALILAEGIETDAHVGTARALGAEFGQGWRFGRPGPLPRLRVAPAGGLPLERRRPLPAPRPGATPFEVVAAERPVRQGDKALLLGFSRQLEHQAPREHAVILSTFQDARFFTPRTQTMYTALGRTTPFVAALGAGLPEDPAPGVRGLALGEEEPLRGEWDVVVLGAHFAAAFVARDLLRPGPDMEREFDFALTYDRELVIQAAATLMARIAAGPARDF